MITNFINLGFLRDSFRTVVHCHGVFDILHAGHLAYFEAAKKIGGESCKLVVTITADEFVNKGPGKPVFNENIRAQMLNALEIVDWVVISNYPTAVQAIEALKPDYYVKGPDYRDHKQDPTGEIINEEKAVHAHGGEIAYTNEEVYSSSSLANRFLVKRTEAQEATISAVHAAGGMTTIMSMLDKLSKLDVAIIGEPIEDVYTYVEPQGISSKSPSISCEFNRREIFKGGAWAIWNHLQGLVGTAKLNHPYVDLRPWPSKQRFLSKDTGQRIFELTDIPKNIWDISNRGQFLDRMHDNVRESDLVLLADFGHGLFDKEILSECHTISKPVALMSQTNSSNLPYNPYTRHHSFDYLCLDLREARIAHHNNTGSPDELAAAIMNHRPSTKALSITLGPNGSLYRTKAEQSISPAFSDTVVDTIGAGDAYFAITSALYAVECRETIIPFLGNIFAGLKTKIIGNKEAVKRGDFIKACQGVLK